VERRESPLELPTGNARAYKKVKAFKVAFGGKQKEKTRTKKTPRILLNFGYLALLGPGRAIFYISRTVYR